MTFATNAYIEPSSPETILIHASERQAATSYSIRVAYNNNQQQMVENSSADSLQSSEDGEEVYPFITYATLNDIDEVQESLIDIDDVESMDREDSDDSLFQMLADEGFSIKKRVSFKPMVKILHFDRDEFASCSAVDEVRRVSTFKLAPHDPIEPLKSFVSSVNFFVGDDDDVDDFDGFSFNS